MTRAELVVVGAGPAGLAVAAGAAARGLDTVVVERRASPLDKPCGEGVMPDGVAALERLGVATDGLGRPFVGIRWSDELSTACGDFPGPPGRGIRRTALSAALVARALEAGASIHWQVRAEGVDDDRLETSAGPYRGRWIVGADGLRSTLRSALGLAGPGQRQLRRRFGVRRHYALTPWAERVEVGFATGAEAYVTPVDDEMVGVAMLWSGEKADFDGLLRRFPDLESRLAGAEPTSSDRGAGPFRQRAAAVIAGRVALVGDASGYVDAITGEGVGLALQQAEALVEALAAGEIEGYRGAQRRLRALPEALTVLLLAVAARPWLRRRLIATMARRPGLLSRLVALNSRQLSARHGPPLLAAVLWGLLRSAAPAPTGVE